MALVIINFNDGWIDTHLNLKNLKYYFPDYEESNVVVRIRDWSYPENDEKTELDSYYYIGEFIEARIEMKLKNFET
jgi:starch synthase